MRAQQTPFIIFSIYNAVNRKDSFNLERQLQEVLKRLTDEGVGFKLVLGAYKGEQERSFLVHAKHEELVKVFCRQYAQESYLKVDGSRYASLVFIEPQFSSLGQPLLGSSADELHIGKFVKVTKAEALSQDAWTYDGVADQYWIAQS